MHFKYLSITVTNALHSRRSRWKVSKYHSCKVQWRQAQLPWTRFNVITVMHTGRAVSRRYQRCARFTNRYFLISNWSTLLQQKPENKPICSIWPLAQTRHWLGHGNLSRHCNMPTQWCNVNCGSQHACNLTGQHVYWQKGLHIFKLAEMLSLAITVPTGVRFKRSTRTKQCCTK